MSKLESLLYIFIISWRRRSDINDSSDYGKREFRQIRKLPLTTLIV